MPPSEEPVTEEQKTKVDDWLIEQELEALRLVNAFQAVLHREVRPLGVAAVLMAARGLRNMALAQWTIQKGMPFDPDVLAKLEAHVDEGLEIVPINKKPNA